MGIHAAGSSSCFHAWTCFLSFFSFFFFCLGGVAGGLSHLGLDLDCEGLSVRERGGKGERRTAGGRGGREGGERERERQRQRQRKRETERDGQRQRDRDKETERETGRDTQREGDRDRDRVTETHRELVHQFVFSSSCIPHPSPRSPNSITDPSSSPDLRAPGSCTLLSLFFVSRVLLLFCAAVLSAGIPGQSMVSMCITFTANFGGAICLVLETTVPWVRWPSVESEHGYALVWL